MEEGEEEGEGKGRREGDHSTSYIIRGSAVMYLVSPASESLNCLC